MAWTATLVLVTSDAGVSVSQLQFTNGTTTVNDTVRGLDATTLVTYCRNKIRNLEYTDRMASFVASPPLGSIDTSIPAASQADVDFANFSRWLTLTAGIANAKSLGWITGAEPMVVDVKNKVLALAAVNLPKMFT